ncbi:cytochrome protein, partial [Hortaea werneckii]
MVSTEGIPWGSLPLERYVLAQWASLPSVAPDRRRRQLAQQFTAIGQSARKLHIARSFRQPYAGLPPDSDWEGILAPLRTSYQRQFALPDAFQPLGSPCFGIIWLRTCYDEGSDEAHKKLLKELDEDMALDVRQNVLDDAALYNYGEDWRRVFEVVPERLLGVDCKDSPHDMLSKSDEHVALKDYKAHIREAQKALDIWEWADNRDVGLARIHLYVIDSYLFVADKIALDTGRALVIFFDTYGRTYILFCLAATGLAFLYIFLRLCEFLHDSKKLRKYPSILPFAGITNLVYVGFNERARSRRIARTEALLTAHQDRPVLRLGPNRLSFASTEAIKDTYGTGTKCIKGDQYTTIGGTPNLLSVVDKEFHSVKRRRLSRAFATAHLLEWEYKVSHNVRKLHHQLDTHVAKGRTLDFRHWSNFFTLDAIVSIALSLDACFMQSGSSTAEITLPNGRTKTIEALACLRSVSRAVEPFVWSRSVYTLMRAFSRFTPYRHSTWAKAADWQVYVGNLVAQRMLREREGRADDDLFASLLKDSKSQSLNLCHAELAAETGHLLDAGSDTTSIALTHVMYCLTKNPEKLLKLRKELDNSLSHLSPEDLPAYSHVRDLPYLRACLDEAMRLRPSLSPGLQRETPPEGLAIGGEWVPGK